MKNTKKKTKDRKKKLSSSSSSNSPQLTEFKYVPPELLTHILASLPVKPLLRFRCVCKTWCSIIDHPDFINMQFKLCNNKSNSGKLLALESMDSRGCLLTLRKVDALTKICRLIKNSERYDFFGRCNSLVLLCRLQNLRDNGMRLCNPSIRKSLLLPPCPLFPCNKCKLSLVIGFAPRTKDFKIIAISFMLTEMRVAVFTLTDQQWNIRNINGLMNMECSTFGRVFGSYYSLPNAYYSEGEAHWLGNNPYGDSSSNSSDKPTHLVSLNFDTESFKYLELPVALDETETSWLVFLLDESLAVFGISSVSAGIWVLKSESKKGEWSLWFSGASSVDASLFFGNIAHFNSRTRERLLYYERDGGCFVYGKKFYNIATCQVRSLGNSTINRADFETYSESLVLAKSYVVEDVSSSPFRWDK